MSHKDWVHRSGHRLDEVVVAVQFAAVLQASGPSEDAGDGVGAGRSSLRGKNTRVWGSGWHGRHSVVGLHHRVAAEHRITQSVRHDITALLLARSPPPRWLLQVFSHPKMETDGGSPSGARGSAGSRCRAPPRPRWSCRRGTRAPMSSVPEIQNLSGGMRQKQVVLSVKRNRGKN